MQKHLFYLLLIPFIFSACNLINPKESIPTYIHIEPFTFSNPDSSFTGSSTNSIPSAVVRFDDQTIGTFDLPCTVPIIMNKSGTVSIVPTVVNQGIKSYVLEYPFYQSDAVSLEYSPGNVKNYSPKTKYSNDLTANSFKLKINFEEGNFFKNLSGDSTIMLEKDKNKVISGDNSGALYLKSPQKSSESISTTFFEYPPLPCYLEFDYTSTMPFQIGLQAETADGKIYGEYLTGFYPKSNRTKIYIDLSTFLQKTKGYTKYFIKLRSSLEEFDGQYSEGNVIIDNIKVIAR